MRKLRARIREALGGVCEQCGEREILEVHHKIQQHYVKNGLNYSRMSYKMLNEIKAGNHDYEILCPTCHKKKTLKQTVIPDGSVVEIKGDVVEKQVLVTATGESVTVCGNCQSPNLKLTNGYVNNYYRCLDCLYVNVVEKENV